ncbi:tetratricopeptide repeat protein [Maridesulfovibrio hydrothermalis]|uniref:TPR repeat-containing protein n=1 Tax=Maridesulfovibrio hydrothermalis AM13 = DSM 14728 TaxID=1121451 RepID=L0R983_9BACT|nr:tetratricopeptide repeat protein [Maridesulfovibrio hydrothermalis]CCO22750.1 TPR repeat-containing protein [Maridesulfovibrio hydrothermalis AM13 = DSM 14728]
MTDSETIKDLSGVFSRQKMAKVGTGVTTRRVAQVGYYFVEQMTDDLFQVRPLNSNFVPTGDPESITREDLLQDYTPEPEMYHKQVLPNMKDLQKTLARADRHRKQGNTFSAEMEYTNAIKIDEMNVRGNFGVGLCLMERGETDRANDVFARLISMDAPFSAEHKHMFNDFGINLRKSKMIPQAIEYYTKAIALSPEDEHLRYNLARAYFENKDYAKAREELNICMQSNPDFEQGKKFIAYLDKNKLG